MARLSNVYLNVENETDKLDNKLEKYVKTINLESEALARQV
jgi:hypothetical protein